MKKYIQLFTIQALFINFLIYSNFFSAQLSISYELEYQPDTLNVEKQKEIVVLKINSEKSYFYNKTKLEIDSLYDSMTASFLKTGVSPEVSKKYDFNTGVYKDMNTNEIYEISNINAKNFIFKTDFIILKWDLINEYKKIFKYNVQKATCNFGGRIWNAWFTTSLPISEGPYKFHGLPGLILEISDSENEYSFKMIGVSTFNEEIKLPNNFINTNSIEFKKYLKNLILDPSMSIRQNISNNNNPILWNGKPIDIKEITERIEKQFFDFMKTHNNPIEKNSIWIK